MLKSSPAAADLAADGGSLRRVDHAVSDLRRGGLVVLRDGLIEIGVLAAEVLTDDALERLAEVAQGPLALALTRRRAAALGLADAAATPGGTVLVAVPDHSPADFARDLADPAAERTAVPPMAPPPEALPLRGLADAAVDLVKLARLLPAAVVARVSPGATAGRIAGQGAVAVNAADVFTYQATAARSLRAVSAARVPLVEAEDARIVAFRPSDGGIEHIAILVGEPVADRPVLVRLHSECFTGDLLGSLRCDCGDQLRGAIAEIGRAGSGVLLYLAQEGRGIGLVNKLRAYELQDRGFDTIDANEQLGFDADERVYLPAAEMLRQLGYTRVRLLTNNPEKVAALTRCGITVEERVPHVFPANGHNDRYLHTKATRSGHLL